MVDENRRTRRHFRGTVIALALTAVALNGCATTSNRGPAGETASSTPSDSRADVAEPEVSNPQTERVRFFDGDPNQSPLMASWPVISDFGQLADLAGTAFVGRIVGVERNVGEDRGNPEEEPAGEGPVTVFDGVRFEVIEVLAGDPELDEDGTIAVGHPAVFELVTGEQIPLTVPPIEVMREDLEDPRGGDGGRTYIVFAFPGRYADGTDAYVFFGPGSVAPLGPDGQSVIETGSSPFVNLSGEVNGRGVDVTLDVIREWIRTGRPPKSAIPEEFRPKSDDDIVGADRG